MTDRKYGWKHSLPDHRDFKYSAHREMSNQVDLPVEVNLIPGMSPVEDQGTLGSCVAHGTAGNLEFIELKDLQAKLPGAEVFDPANFVPMSRLFIYWNARVIDGDSDQDAGTEIKSAISSLRSTGVCRESLWQYDPAQVLVQPPQGCFDEAIHHEVVSSYKLDNTSLTQMKQCLAQGYPFIFGVTLYDSFESEKVAKTGIVPMPKKKEGVQGGHCMLCVGYNQKGWLVRNSWGTDWGMAGYCQMPFEYLTSPDLCSDVWTLRLDSNFGFGKTG